MALLLLGALGLTVACGGGGGGGGVPGLRSTLPTWVTASWTGGAMGPPNDRTDREAVEWDGMICPASHLEFDYNGVVLNFRNRCTIPVTYAICVTQGVLDNTPPCATDPLNTSLNNLRFVVLNPGVLGDFINASGNLSVSFFYCSDQANLTGGPVRCLQ